jgi:hypothetical protein
MKHIRKRFFFEHKTKDFNPDPKDVEEITLSKESNTDVLKGKNGRITFLQTSKDFVIGGFVHKIDGKNYVFPVPELTLVYFNNAQGSIKFIKDSKTRLLLKADITTKLSEPAMSEIYSYFGVISGCIIFLFASIESFVNSIIPVNYKYVRELNNKTEVYNQSQIQESLDFKTKITKVLTEITKKDFFKHPTTANQMIWKLKEFRDNIIHTKQDATQMAYFKLLKMALDFKYEETLDSVAKFMNFYKQDYIIECTCGLDI